MIAGVLEDAVVTAMGVPTVISVVIVGYSAFALAVAVTLGILVTSLIFKTGVGKSAPTLVDTAFIIAFPIMLGSLAATSVTAATKIAVAQPAIAGSLAKIFELATALLLYNQQLLSE